MILRYPAGKRFSSPVKHSFRVVVNWFFVPEYICYSKPCRCFFISVLPAKCNSSYIADPCSFRYILPTAVSYKLSFLAGWIVSQIIESKYKVGVFIFQPIAFISKLGNQIWDFLSKIILGQYYPAYLYS
jgi:hypothetical protein